MLNDSVQNLGTISDLKYLSLIILRCIEVKISPHSSLYDIEGNSYDFDYIVSFGVYTNID